MPCSGMMRPLSGLLLFVLVAPISAFAVNPDKVLVVRRWGRAPGANVTAVMNSLMKIKAV